MGRRSSQAPGDLLRLVQVLVNLLQNAIKYSPDGGQIVVTIEASEQMISWRVSDEGIGIPVVAHER